VCTRLAHPSRVPRGQSLSQAGRAWLTAGAAVLVALALLLPELGSPPFDDPGEGQHAEIAREITTGGDWVTLRLNGVRYFDKPPLLYWLAAASFRLFGPSEAAARVLPLLGALLAVGATALLGARLLGAVGGLLAAGALLSSVLFVAFGRYLRPETLFVAAIQWGFTGLLLGRRGASPARSPPWGSPSHSPGAYGRWPPGCPGQVWAFCPLSPLGGTPWPRSAMPGSSGTRWWTTTS
jgi:4-amino-4-deoxy-L-arabinose transferase-like glycosyltransferase